MRKKDWHFNLYFPQYLCVDRISKVGFYKREGFWKSNGLSLMTFLKFWKNFFCLTYLKIWTWKIPSITELRVWRRCKSMRNFNFLHSFEQRTWTRVWIGRNLDFRLNQVRLDDHVAWHSIPPKISLKIECTSDVRLTQLSSTLA